MKAQPPPAFAARDTLSPLGRAVPARDFGEIAAELHVVVLRQAAQGRALGGRA